MDRSFGLRGGKERAAEQRTFTTAASTQPRSAHISSHDRAAAPRSAGQPVVAREAQRAFHLFRCAQRSGLRRVAPAIERGEWGPPLLVLYVRADVVFASASRSAEHPLPQWLPKVGFPGIWSARTLALKACRGVAGCLPQQNPGVLARVRSATVLGWASSARACGRAAMPCCWCSSRILY